MQLERRPLYNLLRMHWLQNPSMVVEPWQVENFRQLPLETLFTHLAKLNIKMDRAQFFELADTCSHPEELLDQVIQERPLSTKDIDHAYLLLFELWRRLLAEKPSLSIFCDELDHQIYLYDHEEIESNEGIQDALANLQVILEENTDLGVDPKEVFQSVSSFCASHLEQFLYDFIFEQVELNNDSYAQELIDAFFPYILDKKWFNLLKARVLSSQDLEATNALLDSLIKEAALAKDLDFNVELLSQLTQIGDCAFFKAALKITLLLLKTEEDLQDLLDISADFCKRMDLDQQEKKIQALISSQKSKSLNAPLSKNDPRLKDLLLVIEAPHLL